MSAEAATRTQAADRPGAASGAAAMLHRRGVAAWRFTRRKPLGALGFLIVFITVLAALFAPIITFHDPLIADFTAIKVGQSFNHWLGTDEFGRDLYSRIVYGARVSLIVAFASIGMGTTIGAILGIFSAFIGGRVDDFFSRLTDIMIAFPGILLAMAFITVFGIGLWNVVWAIGISFAPPALRVARGATLSVKNNVFVEAAHAVGASNMRIIFRHLLPNVLAPIIVVASVQLGSAILIESALSYLGLGVPPPAPSWGRMLAGSVLVHATTAPWLVIFPGAAITILVLGFNLFGDALRDVWDPRLRGR
ncbi:MAG: ABC transporter permease [Chloroflexota bacterium]|nr:ABC transporter permease [Chloroflexota bacterium]